MTRTVTAESQDMEYSIRVKGVVSDVVLAAFPDLSARVMRSDTVLIGTLPDQAALHGLLAQIEALGLELIEVRRPRHGRSVRL